LLLKNFFYTDRHCYGLVFFRGYDELVIAHVIHLTYQYR
jgi:hypothetical protein